MMIQAVAIAIGVRYIYLPYPVQAVHGVAVYPKRYKIAHGAGVSLKNRDLFGELCIPKCRWDKISSGCYW